MKEIKVIGILENHRKKAVELAYYILKESYDNVVLINDKRIKYNKREESEKVFDAKDLKFFLKNTEKEIDYLILDTLNEKILNLILEKRKLNTLIDARPVEDHHYENKKNSSRNILFRNIMNNGIVIINSDNKEEYNEFEFIRDKVVITYGLDSKATITTSSVPMRDEVSFICCLQRGIMSFDSNEIEPMEFPVKFYYYNEVDANDVLPVIALALRYEISLETIQELLKNYKNNI